MQGIYCIEHIDSGKRYYGSSKNVLKRLIQHRRDLRKRAHCNILLQRAFDKHGEEKFRFYLIEETQFESIVDLLKYEQDWLDKNVGGYNIAPAAGGDCISAHPNRSDIIQKIADSVKAKMGSMTKSQRKIKFGKPGDLNPNWKGRSYRKSCPICQQHEISIKSNTCADCSDKSGSNNPFYGHVHSDETKLKLREKMSGDSNWIKGIDPAKLSYTKKYQLTYPDGTTKIVIGLKLIAQEFDVTIENVHATIKRISCGKIPKRGVFAGMIISEV